MGQFIILAEVGLSQALVQVIEEIHGPGSVLGYIDEFPEKQGMVVAGKPILGEWLEGKDAGKYQAATVLSPRNKGAVVEKALARGLGFPNLIHPRSWVSPSLQLGRGNIIFPFATVLAPAVMGDFNFLHAGAYLGHHTRLGSNCFLAAGAKVVDKSTLGDGVFMGAGACVVKGVHVGSWTTVGANSVVNRSLAEGLVAVGAPARPLPGKGM
jgi:UDP-perosamine 4-acetyltransferase